MTDISRDADSRQDLLAYWEGDAPDGEASITVSMGEVAVILDGDDPVLELPPGRHRLTEDTHEDLAEWLDGDDDDVQVAFVTTTPVEVSFGGEFTRDGDVATFSGTARVRVTNGSDFLGLLESLDDEESMEDWLGDEIGIRAGEAMDARKADRFFDIVSGAMNVELEEDLSKRVNEALGEFGVSVAQAQLGEFEPDEATKARVSKEAMAEANKRFAAEGPVKPEDLIRSCPNGHGDVRGLFCPRCGATLV